MKKGNIIIREFIKETACQGYFRYNSIGEIIPNGRYYVWRDYENASALTENEEDACYAIRVLNLNHYSLVDARKGCLDALLSSLKKKTKEEWKAKIEEWLHSDVFPDFIELRIQYIETIVK